MRHLLGPRDPPPQPAPTRGGGCANAVGSTQMQLAVDRLLNGFSVLAVLDPALHKRLNRATKWSRGYIHVRFANGNRRRGDFSRERARTRRGSSLSAFEEKPRAEGRSDARLTDACGRGDKRPSRSEIRRGFLCSGHEGLPRPRLADELVAFIADARRRRIAAIIIELGATMAVAQEDYGAQEREDK